MAIKKSSRAKSATAKKIATVSAAKPVKIALLGFGTVGSSVARVLAESKFPGVELTHIYNRGVERKTNVRRGEMLFGSVVWTENFDDILTSRADIVVVPSAV